MAYIKTDWEDFPSTNTPINAQNLNKMDAGIKDLDNNVSSLITRMTNAETNIDDITIVQAVEYSYNNNVAVQPPIVFYKNGLIYVYAQLITGVTGVELSLLQFSKYKAISGIGDFTSPINCHGGCDGETGIRAGSDVVFVNISTSNGNGKVFIVIPVEEK